MGMKLSLFGRIIIIMKRCGISEVPSLISIKHNAGLNNEGGLCIMKKFLIIAFVSLIFLTGCGNSADYYINWTDTTQDQIQRLDEANIKYEIRDG